MEGTIAEVAIPRPVEGTFDYAIPESFSDLPSGVRVRVRFGKGEVVGYLLKRKIQSNYKGRLQPILASLDEEPILQPVTLQLARWMSCYYACPLGLVLQAMIPQRLSRAKPSRNKIVYLAQDLHATMRQIEMLKGTAPQQAHLLQMLLSIDSASIGELLQWAHSSQAPLRSLIDKGLVFVKPKPLTALRSTFQEADRKVTLTHHQTDALNAIERALQGDQGTFLLQGVNGSGKTEVYLHAVQRAVQQGETSILTVPEISLTPQFIARIRHRLGDSLAVLHSGLTEAQQAGEWSRLREGAAQVVVGVRSACLVPLDGLGLIIIDEEHEPTYKQESPEPRYHARDVVLQRADIEKAVVILGSATPSLETLHRAQSGELDHLLLPERVVHAPFPTVQMIDMNKEKSWLSLALSSALQEVLASGKQAMLLLNRRGYGVAVCKRCRRTQRCPNCGISFTFHTKPAQLRCHYCNVHLKRNVCQTCQGELDLFGLGTQRVETALRKNFPTARLARMDSDAVKKRQHGQILNQFKEGKIDILLGTQMIGLGHDFRNVALMGIVDADTLLHVPDFRASERTFQLVSQATGRAGRGDQPANVLLQTKHADHYVFQHAVKGDYDSFAKEELSFRKAYRYPPFSHIIRMEIRHRNETQAQTLSLQLRDELQRNENLETLGPSRAIPYRWRGYVRFQLLLKSDNPLEITDVLLDRIKQLGATENVKLDVDP